MASKRQLRVLATALLLVLLIGLTTGAFFACQQIMSKGYCVDLSDHEVIRGKLQKMHPFIATQVIDSADLSELKHTSKL